MVASNLQLVAGDSLTKLPQTRQTKNALGRAVQESRGTSLEDQPEDWPELAKHVDTWALFEDDFVRIR